MPGNQTIPSLHDPPQRPSPKQGSSTAISKRSEDIETRLPPVQETAIGKAHVQRLLTVAVQFGRHRRGGQVLERDSLPLLLVISPLDPSDATASKFALPVPDDGRTRLCCHDSLSAKMGITMGCGIRQSLCSTVGRNEQGQKHGMSGLTVA